MKMNKEKLHKQIETMNKEQLLELCKSTTSIIDDLQNKIDKAIEYIERKQEDINNGGNDMSYQQLTHLLDILRGEE